MRIQRLICAVMFALIGAAADATAQTPPRPQEQIYGYPTGPWMMGPGGMMGGSPMGPWMVGRYGNAAGRNTQGRMTMCSMMNYRTVGRLAYLKTKLQVTGAQEAFWNAYLDAVQKNFQNMAARCNDLIGANARSASSLPDRLAMHEQFMAAQLDAMRAIERNLKPLYTALNDNQKEVANQLIWCPARMM